MRELYVYYRVAAEDGARLEAAVHLLHTRLERDVTGLHARLLVRPDTVDGEQTWMETYSFDPQPGAVGIDPALQTRIDAEAGALSPLLRSPRHTEVFIARPTPLR